MNHKIFEGTWADVAGQAADIDPATQVRLEVLTDEDVGAEIRKGAEIFLSHGAQEVYVFGSAASGTLKRGSDIDFAIRGMPPQNFYPAVGDALEALRFAIDVVDLDLETSLTRHLINWGKLVRVA